MKSEVSSISLYILLSLLKMEMIVLRQVIISQIWDTHLSEQDVA